MEIFGLNLDVNETREVALVGNYFELRNALYAVDIELLDRTGGVVNLMRGALESDFVESQLYQTVRIKNGATPQTVKFWYGVGSAGSRRFSGSITGSVALDAATIASLINAKYGVRPEVSTGSFNNTASLSANTPLTIFTPAANVNGAILLSADISEFDASFGNGGFLAKSSAPTSATDGEPMLMTRCIAAYSTTNLHGGNTLPKEQYIAPGLGLYFIRTVALAAANGNFRACRVKLL